MRRSILHKVAYGALVIFILLGLMHRLISNDSPIVCETESGISFPAFQDLWEDWTGQHLGIATKQCEAKLYPPNQYDYYEIGSREDKLLPPLSKGRKGMHIFGTDVLGRDVFAGVLRGFYISIRVSLIATIIAYLFGVFIGILMGYWKDDFEVNIGQLAVLIAGLFFLVFYTIYPAQSVFFYFLLLFIVTILWWGIGQLPVTPLKFPFDSLMMKCIELLKSIPSLIIILVLIPVISSGSINALTALIAFFSWRNFALHARAETIALKEESFIQSAQAQGQSWLAIIRFHILPNILPTVLTLFSFVLASTILLESSLSFLGIGLGTGEVSWGSLIALGRTYPQAWWLFIFPGLALVLAIFVLNILVDNKIKIDGKSA